MRPARSSTQTSDCVVAVRILAKDSPTSNPRVSVGSAIVGVRVPAPSSAPAEDLLDERALGGRVVVHVLPLALGEAALERFVLGAGGGVGPEAVAERERAVGLGVALRPDVHVDAAVGAAEHAMAGLADAELVAGGLQGRDER